MQKAITDFTDEQIAELDALAKLPDDQIDTSDIPEITDWSGGRRGVFYRPRKQEITLRLDSDVVAWFKLKAKNEPGYQTDINRVLREHMQRVESNGRKDAARV